MAFFWTSHTLTSLPPSHGCYDGRSDGDLSSSKTKKQRIGRDIRARNRNPEGGRTPPTEITARVTEFWQVSSDEEAIELMNDSPYGLTASVWTKADSNPESEQAFLRIVDELETGTVFLNRFVESTSREGGAFSCRRCDYLDPALAWTGVKNSGRGISLSKFGAYGYARLLVQWLIQQGKGMTS